MPTDIPPEPQVVPEPRTPTGRRDHDDAWNSEDESTGNHGPDRDTCLMCHKIARIEAEAREDGFSTAIKRSLRAIQRDQAASPPPDEGLREALELLASRAYHYGEPIEHMSCRASYQRDGKCSCGIGPAVEQARAALAAHPAPAGLDAAVRRICNVLDNDEGAAELYEAALELYRSRLVAGSADE